jgi:hypothetical protein
VRLAPWIATLLFVVAFVLYAWLLVRRPGVPAQIQQTDADERRD